MKTLLKKSLKEIAARCKKIITRSALKSIGKCMSNTLIYDCNLNEAQRKTLQDIRRKMPSSQLSQHGSHFVPESRTAYRGFR